MNINKRIEDLRGQMSKVKLDAYIILPNDPHQSEYVAPHWHHRQWISGFTGSAGVAVLTHNFAGLWTDSRYFIQAQQELAESSMELMKLRIPHTPEYIGWLCANLPAGSTVGIDASVVSVAAFETMQKAFYDYGLQLRTTHDLIDDIWADRPSLPSAEATIYPIQYTGKSRTEKINEVRRQMAARRIDMHLITTLDDIAWLLNIRGSDVVYNPVVIAYAVITESDAYMFVPEGKLPDTARAALENDGVQLQDYEAIIDFLASMSAATTLLIDKNKISKKLYASIPDNCKMVTDSHLTTLAKSLKNSTEITHTRQAMIQDGVSLTRFFMWLEAKLNKKESVTEYEVGVKLREFRAAHSDFQGESFGTIAGYAGNGAIVHYSAKKEKSASLLPKGIFLLDSGGQYLCGTTDITRTVQLGNPTADQIRDFTLVLKGHIQLASAVFPHGTKGYQLDILARKPLWDALKNYGHGTGHGVGFYMNVHEGPQSIGTSPINQTIEPGMITSNEPGLYVEGEYGIRIENLVLTVEHEESPFGKFLTFETLSLFPIDQALIDRALLDKAELTWLNDYHQKVYTKLSPYLNEQEKAWLKQKTESL